MQFILARTSLQLGWVSWRDRDLPGIAFLLLKRG